MQNFSGGSTSKKISKRYIEQISASLKPKPLLCEFAYEMLLYLSAMQRPFQNY